MKKEKHTEKIFNRIEKVTAICHCASDNEIEEAYMKYVMRLPDQYIRSHFEKKDEPEEVETN